MSKNKFQLELSNRFEHLYINDEDSVQAAYDKLEKVLNETALKPLLKTWNVKKISINKAIKKVRKCSIILNKLNSKLSVT